MGLRPARATALFFCWWASTNACTCGAEPIDAVTVSLRTTPDALDFRTLPIGATSLLTLTVVSDGSAPYAPTEPPRTDTAGFFIDEPCALPLNPGDACEMRIGFSPTTEGSHQGHVRFELPNGPLEVPLVGAGTPADVLLTPAAIDYGEVPAGGSAQEIVTVQNVGASDLDVALAVSGDGFLVDGARAATVAVAAGEAVDVSVVFSPARGGDYAASLVAEVCGPACGPAVALTGAGLAPRIEIEPRVLELGEVLIGDEANASLTISNAGAGALGVTSAVLVTATADLVVDDAALPLSLVEGESVQLPVRYAPSVPRAALDAVLSVRSSDPLSPLVSIPIRAVTPGAALEVLPSALHFGVLDLDDSVAAGVVVRAIGTAPVTLESIELAGAAFALSALPPLSTLEPGDALLFDVTATARAVDVAAGGATGTLTARGSNGVSATAALQFLSGTSGCQPRSPDGNEDLGAVRVGQGLSGSITIQNIGDAPCVLVSAAPAAGLPFDVGFDFSSARAVTLAPSGTGFVDVGFTAVESGPRGAYWALLYEGAAAPLLVSAVGVGVLGDLQGEPPVLEFGPVAAGCPAAPRTATFVNRGAGSLTVSSVRLQDAAAPFSFVTAGVPSTLAPGVSMAAVVEPDLVEVVGVHETTLVATTVQDLSASVRLRLEVTAAGTPVTETFIVGEVSAVDVLFVVDDSGSMADDQEILADNFSRFVETAFDTPGLDFHLGVTTTDVLSGFGGRLVAPPLSNGTGGALVDEFRAQALVGTEGSGLECGLEAVRLALEVHRYGADAGFLRADAALSVVIVTDEEDSGEALVSLDPTLSRPAASYVETLLAAKGGNVENTPILFSLVGRPSMMPRYETVAAAFSGVVLDIGSETWGDDLSVIGAATFGLQRRFTVGGTPATGSVVVRVDGVATEAFVAAGNTVTLDDAPPAGAVVEIAYQVDCS